MEKSVEEKPERSSLIGEDEQIVSNHIKVEYKQQDYDQICL
jgi:hypothetical protein